MRTRWSKASRNVLGTLLGGAALALGAALWENGESAALGAPPKAKAAAKPGMTAKKKKPKALGGGGGSGLWKLQADPGEAVKELPDEEVLLRIPQGGNVEDVTYPSAPSNFVAVGGRNGVEVWDLAARKRVGVVRGEGIEKPFALSADGEMFAAKTGGFSRGVAVFATKKGKQIAKLKAEGPFLDYIDFGGENKVITGTSGDKVFEVWDIDSEKSETDIGVKSRVAKESLTVSPGGKYLAMASAEGKGVWVYDVESGKRVGEQEIPKNGIFDLGCKGLAWSADGTMLAGVFESFGVFLFCWDVENGQTVAEFKWDDKTGNVKPPPFFKNCAIDWLPDKSGWLLFGNMVVDRESGEKVFTVPSDTADANKGPRRIVGPGLVLIPIADRGASVVRSYKLPTDKIAAAAKIVAAGGNAADATLPPLTKPDLSSAKKLPLENNAAWSAAADPGPASRGSPAHRALALKCQGNEVQRLLFGGLDAGQVAVTSIPGGLNEFDKSQNEGKPRRVETYDLAGGRFIARFDLPGVTEPLAVSPDGTRVIAADTKEHSRLDAYAIADGKPVASWRPHEGDSGDDRAIVWADFLDNDRVLTASKGGTIALWSLPACKAVWIAERACDGPPTLSPGRKLVAAYDNGMLRVLDAATGATKGVGAASTSPGAKVELNGLDFLADGSAVVALVSGSQLVRWDMKTGKVTADFHAPMLIQPQSSTYCPMVEFCAPGHALLDGRILMDLDRRAHVWTYIGAKTSAGGPDGRHWYVAASQFALPGQNQAAALVPMALPDPSIGRVVAMVGNASAKPLLKVGMKVAVTLECNGPAKDPNGYKTQIFEAISTKLRNNGMTIGDGGGVWIIVHVDEKDTGKTFKYRNFGDSAFNAPRGEIPLKNFECEMQIADAQGRIPLAPKQSFPMPAPFMIHLQQGEDLGNKLRDMAWDNMKSYLVGFGLPYFVSRQSDGVAMLPGVTNLAAAR